MSSSFGFVGAGGGALAIGGGGSGGCAGFRSRKSVTPMPPIKRSSTMAYLALLAGGTPAGGRFEGGRLLEGGVI
jgi:hypothetical protein